MGTYVAKAADIDASKKKWYIIDAKGKTLGRLSTEVAKLLMGKNKPEFMPNLDMGDFVIVINADQVVVTGKKLSDKLYRHHTGYPGGLKAISYQDMIRRHPTFPVEEAVRGMLPKNALGRQMFRKLKVYAGAEHGHQAQKPEVYEI